MTFDELLAYCLAKPGAREDEPWEDVVVAKVGEKIFAFLGDTTIGVKCGDRQEANEWLHRYPDHAHVMSYIGRYGWNRLDLNQAITDAEILEAVDDSYLHVVAKLPKSRRPAGWDQA